MSVEDKIKGLGLVLPPPPEPAGSYTRAVRTGNLVFVAGQLPIRDGGMAYAGRLGAELSTEEGYEAARLCALNGLSVLRAELDSLESITRLVRLTGYVASAEGYIDQAKVVNGASELLGEVLGQRGIHARLAVGVVGLPLGAAVELEIIAEVE